LNESLVADLRARRPEALAELLRLHGAEMHAVAYLILRDHDHAEEVTADTLLTCWHKVGGLREPDRLRPWLLRVATRLALRRRVRQARLATVSIDGQPEPAEREVPIVDRLVLREALDRLPPRLPAVVALHHVAGLTVAETAEAVGRSPNTIKSQLREALTRLRAELSDPSDGAKGRSPAAREEPS